jgi:hypothetical protein
MVLTSLPSGDLFSSASWLPLVTLLPLVPSTGWWRPCRPDPLLAGAAVLLGVLAWRLAPDLVHVQDVAGSDPHGARFHYGGMAAVYVASACGAAVAAVFPRDRAVLLLLGAGTTFIGAASWWWPQYDSALRGPERWWYVGVGAVIVVRSCTVRPAVSEGATTLAAGDIGEVSWRR